MTGEEAAESMNRNQQNRREASINMRVTREMHAEVNRVAQQHETSASAAARMLVRESLNRRQEEATRAVSR